MAPTKRDSDSLSNLSEDELADIVKINDALDQEEARINKEEIEEIERKRMELDNGKKIFKRLRKSPLEIFNRTLLLVFLSSFLFSFFLIYNISHWWFFIYCISAFSCIFYTPNRKAIKELLAAWPNIEGLIKSRRR